MQTNQRPWAQKSVWLLALAYAGAYAAFLVSLRYGTAAPAAWPAVLTGFAIGAILLLPIPIATLGQRAQALGAPSTRGSNARSGISAGFIALATAMAFSLGDVGILAALLLMRGGVLILSPIIDRMLGRHVGFASWTALSVSLMAVCLALWGLDTVSFTPALGITLAIYLGGYVVRLSLMTHGAKSEQPGLRAAYLSQELTWTATTLALAAIVFWLTGRAPLAAFLPYVPAGLAYAAALTAGSLIYLDARENSFTIPINRGASLLAGLAVSICLASFGASPAPTAIDLVAACLIIVALAVLAISPVLQRISLQRPRSWFSPRRR